MAGNLDRKLRLPRIRVLLHAANMRYGKNGFTFLPKDGVLRNFSPWKIRRFRPGLNPANLGTEGQHATSRQPQPLVSVVTADGYGTGVASSSITFNTKTSYHLSSGRDVRAHARTHTHFFLLGKWKYGRPASVCRITGCFCFFSRIHLVNCVSHLSLNDLRLSSAY